MATNPYESFLSGGNIQFIEALHARFLEDPSSVDASWRELFASMPGGNPIVDGPPPGWVPPAALQTRVNGSQGASGASPTNAAANAALLQSVLLQSKVDQAIAAFRARGHMLARLDPLERPPEPVDDASELALLADGAFTPQEQGQVVDTRGVLPVSQAPLRDVLARLKATYSGHIGVEYITVDSTRREWLRSRLEQVGGKPVFAREAQQHILQKLSVAEAFEHVLIVKDRYKKRFSADGAESIIPMIDAMLEVCGETGAEEVLIGMAHRGRLNVLANILKKSPDQIYSEFKGPTDFRAYLGRGDVKYHMGFSSDHVTQDGKKIHLSLAFNPSHLEVVNPVVTGRVRAKQERRKDAGRNKVIPLTIHGDAAFSGQGVVAETLNMAALTGYTVGGTIHVVINNQVGFTTDPEDGRSFRYCTGFAQMLNIPIFHVNGDDPEACVFVMKLATEYRQTFGTDVVVDLVCYRRFGHNEAEDPILTQPVMYELINARPKVREIYGAQLMAQGSAQQADVDAAWETAKGSFMGSYERVQQNNAYKSPSYMDGLWKNYRGGADKDVPQPNTGVDKAKLSELLNKLAAVPEGFTPLPQIAKILAGRRAMAEGKERLNWGAAENLAYATLLAEGVPVRLTGQDVERGTFSHRHARILDAKTNAKYTPLANLGGAQGTFSVFNSPLSEMAPVGFEFGYSLDYPDALVIWEAQFGDFANMAQAIIDQFISASEEKWKRLSGLTLLLPHGYEGMGPEHSSARLERFLDLCGDDNIQVCYPSTSAQIFHLLRRQVVRPIRKPLVVMTPKQLLREGGATCSLDELATGSFQRVIADPANPEAGTVEKLVFCAGKVFHTLNDARTKNPDSGKHVALVRIEQLYPFPADEVAAALAKYPNLKSVCWAQEEPRNMGSWRYISPRLIDLLKTANRSALELHYIGRAEAASPATGVEAAHQLEQQMIVDDAFSRGGTRAG